MKHKLKHLYIFLVFIFTLAQHSHVKAQDYKTLIAYKNGAGPGFMAKKLLPNESAFSAQIIFKQGGFTLGAFRTFHEVAFPKKNSQYFFYYGYGTHFRYYREYTSKNIFKPFRPGMKRRGNYVALGLDGILGIEYRFLKYPFVLSTEFNPNFELGGANYFKVNLNMFTAGIAYTF
ncbi:hypothetical protein [Plebeiibacterium marinum]|uniref:DUF3575 domain-containing protein n=1 Tax=Plebeiibacterium marinum TaxID=2992111 RepID=A0AAE3SIU4_9BACT|nr:hypothetical protein [Plebeiobacterium marinum]MCW3804967.1 hypothetical protein [Plebeiobacterium marinum]